MADASAVIKLKAVDDGLIATVNNASNAFTVLQFSTTALSAVFKGLEKASSSNFAQMSLGATNAAKLSSAISKLTDVNSVALKSFSALSNATFIGGQFLTAAKGVQDATAAFSRLPQTLELLRTSGVSTKPIEDFYDLTDAVRGSQASLESFAITAVQNLGKFEQAAARAGTILRSSVNFDSAGTALRATQKEQLDNAFQVQNIVNTQLDNTVSSTEALLGQYEVLSSGFTKAADSQQVLAAGLKLTGIGRAGGIATDPGETLRLLGKTLNAYQLSAQEAGKTASVLNAIVENGITTIPELSQGFGQTATSARAANIDLKNLAASTAVLTTQGINTATALTGLQRVAGSIIQKTPDAQKALDKLSLNGQKIRFDQAEIQSKGFTKALLDLNQAAGGNVKVLQEIFPEEVAFRTVLGLLAQDGQKLSSTLATVSATTATSLDDVFKTASGDRVSRFEKIVNRFQELIIKIAQSIAPVFEPGLAVLEKIASFFSNLPDPVKDAIGSFIVFQITVQSTTSAVGILLQTLGSLATTYVSVRLVSLLLSGQLGKELGVVRDLITQKKGLLAATLQLFGIDQRYRLGAEATTNVLQKQSLVSQALAATRNKAAEIIGANVSGLKGSDAKAAGKQVIEKGKQAVGGVVESVKNAGLGALEATGIIATPQLLGADGKPLNSTGLDRIKGEVSKVGDAIASGLDNVKGKVKPKVEEVQTAVSSLLVGADGKPLSVKSAVSNVQSTAQQQIEKLTPAPKQSALGAPEILFGLIATDDEYTQLAQKADAAFDKQEKLTDQLKVQREKLNKAALEALELNDAADIAAYKAADAVTAFDIDPEQRQKLIDDAKRKREAASAADDNVRGLTADADRTERDLGKATSEGLDTQNQLLARQEKLSASYAVVAEKEALARRLNVAAVTLEEKATLAKVRADELEAIAAYKPDDIYLQAQAKQARAAATSLEAKAANVKARAETEAATATQLATAIDREATLAAQGLATTRIFGREVVFSTAGPLGAINKLLATEITLTQLSAVASVAATNAKVGLKVALKLLGGAASLPILGLGGLVKALSELTGNGLLGKASAGFELLATKMGGLGKIRATDILNLFSGGIKGGFNVLNSGLTSLLGTLGPLAPLLGVAAIGAVVFREELFGLGKQANEAANSLGELLKKDEEIAKQFGREQKLIEFKAELKPNASAAQVETRLEQLRLSGDLTTGQFNQLRKTLTEVGNQGQLAGESLDKFKSQLDSIKQGAQGEPEKGVGDRIGDFFKGIPGFLGSTIDFGANYNPATQLLTQGASLLKGEGFIDVAKNREADRLIQNFSRLSQVSEVLGNASNSTSQKTNQLKAGQGLTDEINRKIIKGEKISATDLEQQDSIVAGVKARNENLISGIDKELEKQREIVAQIKDPELKASAEFRVNSLQQEKTALEKRNEALKQGNEEFKKYYLETLPALKRAIIDTTNLQQGLSNSQVAFNQQFKLDAQGKPTAFLKDITTLRNEGQQYVSSVLESYQAGQFEQVAGPTLPGQNLLANPGVSEQEAARRLREVRDSKITTPDGVSGFRFGISDRIAATQQIVEFEQSASKQRGEAIKLEVEQAKLGQQQRVISVEAAEDKISALNIKSIQESLNQKQIEIEQYKQFPVRKVQLEREAAAIRVQLEQSIANEANRKLELNRNRVQERFNLEVEKTKALQAERVLSAEDTEKKIAQIQIQAARVRLNNLVGDYNKSGKSSVDLEQKIASARAQLRQQEAAEEARQLNLKREQRQNQYNIEIEQIKSLQSERLISSQEADTRIAQQQVQSTRDRLNNLIEDYNKSGKSSVELEQKIAQTRAQLRQQEAQEVERIFNLDQERQKRLIANSTQLQILILQRQSNSLENQGKDLESGKQLSDSFNQLQNVFQEQSNSQIENQLKLTSDIEKRSQLETTIAENKIKTLALTQQQEIQSLETQTKINQLQLEREIVQLRIQKIENQRQVSELNLELIKAKREKRTSEEIVQIELQIKSNQQQSELLDEQGSRLEANKIQQQQITENSRRELEVKQGIARANAEIEMRLIKQKEIQASIEKQIQNIQFATQALQLAGQIQSTTLENNLKLYDQQKTLLQAGQDAAKGRVDYMTGELQLSIELTNNEDEKRKLAQTIAAIKLRSLEQQIASEKQVLELNLQQQSAQLEVERSKNQVSQSQANAAFIQSQADYQKLAADPAASPEALRAAQLNIQAKQEEIFSLGFQSQILDQQGKTQGVLGNLQRQSLGERSQLQIDQAKVEFARTLPEDEQRQILEKFREGGVARTLGVLPQYASDVQNAFVDGTVNKYFGGRAQTPVDSYYASIVNNRLQPPNLSSLQANFPNYEQYRQNQIARFQEFGYQNPTLNSKQLTDLGNQELKSSVEKLNELVNKKLSTPSTLNIQIPITNKFENASRTNADEMTVQIRKNLYDLAKELSR